jgi:hypothetical protein
MEDGVMRDAGMSNLEAALDYAQRGLPVFPVWQTIPMLPPRSCFTCTCNKTIRCKDPGKHPVGSLLPHGFNDASTDEVTVRHWWEGRPNANVGIATASLVVVDMDPRHGGDAAMTGLERKHGTLPPTWRVITGGAGLHVYFRAPVGRKIPGSIGTAAPGIDIRATRGYVVAPPSNHISGST